MFLNLKGDSKAVCGMPWIWSAVQRQKKKRKKSPLLKSLVRSQAAIWEQSHNKQINRKYGNSEQIGKCHCNQARIKLMTID